MYDALFIALIIVAFIWDVNYHKLPNWLTAIGMVTGLMYHLLTGGINGFLFSGLGLLVSGGIFLLLYMFKAIGAGDVKLFAAIGAIMGIEFTLYLMMYSVVYAGVIGIVILLVVRTPMQRVFIRLYERTMRVLQRNPSQLDAFKQNKRTRFPFMYAVLPAVLTTYYYFL